MENMINREAHLRALRAVTAAYERKDFTDLFPLLAEDCVWQSQWVLTPERGRERVIQYYTLKKSALANSKSRIRCTVVELVGGVHLVPGWDGQGRPVSAGIFCPEGKLCLYMEQLLDGEIVETLIDLTLNEEGLITQIDICMPELFQFFRYEPEESDGDEVYEEISVRYDRNAYLKKVIARNKAKTPEERAARLAELKAKLEAGTATEQDKDELVSMPI